MFSFLCSFYQLFWADMIDHKGIRGAAVSVFRANVFFLWFFAIPYPTVQRLSPLKICFRIYGICVLLCWLARSASALFRMRSKKRIGDRHDTTRHPSLLIWKLTIFDEKSWNCSALLIWKLTILDENWWTLGALLIWKLASFDENWWKSVKLRRTPYLKTGNFRRKFVKICEIKAHFLFENK